MFETKTPGVRIDRLFMAIEMLREIALNEETRTHFDLQHWIKDLPYGRAAGHSDPVVKGRRADGCVIVAPLECGYAACVCGWMGSLPEFNRQGFCLAPDADLRGSIVPFYHDAEGNREWGWSAVCAFFGIGHPTANELFLASRYTIEESTSPLAVAQRIEDYIAGEVENEL